MLTLAHLQQRRSRRWLLGLTLLLLVTLLISLCAGEQWIPPGEWLSAKGQLFIWQIRLPPSVYQPSAAGGGGAGDHLQRPDDLGSLLLHLF